MLVVLVTLREIEAEGAVEVALLGGRGITTHGSFSAGRGAPAKMPMTLREMSCRGTGCAIGAVLELELVADTGAGSEASEPNVAREG